MANGQQASDDQFDILEHPTLGTLKFPKEMGVDERNASIDRLLAQEPGRQSYESGKRLPPLAPGTYQGVKGGGLHTVDQTVPNALIQGIEGIFGVKPRPDDWQHPYLDAFAQAMKSGARLVEQTAKDPFTPAHAIIGGVSQAISDIQSGIAKRDPRQVAGGVGQIIGLRGMSEAGEQTAKTGLSTVAGGPFEGGPDPLAQEPGTSRGAQFKAVKELQRRGFSNAEISAMDSEARRDALAGVRKPNTPPIRTAETPAAPAPIRSNIPSGDTVSSRPTEAVPGARAGATNQAAAAPITAQRPTEVPQAPTSTAIQGVVGDVRGITHTLPSWATQPIPPISSASRDPLTGMPVQPSVPAEPTPIKGPLVNQRPGEAYGPINPQEIVDLQRQLESQGWKGTVTPENIHEIQRRANDIRAVIAPRPDEVGAIREEHRATLEQPGRPAAEVQSNESGITPPDPYYKPVPQELTPTPEVEVPKPEPIKELKVPPPTSHALPSAVTDRLALMDRLHTLILEAPTDEARLAAQAQWNKVSQSTKPWLKQHLTSLSPEQRQTLASEKDAEGDRFIKQASKVNEIIAGHPLAQAMRREMAPGQPVRSHPEQTTQFTKEGVPIRTVGTTPNKIREALHTALDDKVSMQWDQIALEQRARASEKGIDPNTIQPEGYRLEAPEEYAAKRIEAKKEVSEIQKSLIDELRTIVKDRVEAATLVDNGVVIKQPSEAEIKEVHDSALKEILNRKNEKGQTLTERIKELQEYIGRSPQRPVYVKKGEPVVEGGVVSSGAAVPHKTLELARRIWGTKLNKIPSDIEWQNKAKEFEEKGRIAKAIASAARAAMKVLDVQPPKGKEGEAGFIGQGGHAGGGVSSVEELARPGRFVRVSRSGNLTDQNKVPDFSNLREGEAGYQVRPNGKIELKAGQETPYTKRAISAYAREVYGAQRGAGGIGETVGMTVGGVAGMVAGHVVGGVHGMYVGGILGTSLGFMTPTLLQTTPVRVAMKTMANIVRSAGLTIKNWFQGPPQVNLQGLHPDMDNILHEQKVHADRSTNWLTRAKQLPAEMYQVFNQFAYVADKRNMPYTGRVMMMFDSRGKAFRDLTIPDNQSLYLALANAGGDALGQRRDIGLEHNEIVSDANKLGLAEVLDRYLNLLAYKRTNEVLQEHIADLDKESQDLQQKLQNPRLTDRQRIALEDDLKDTRKMQKEIEAKVQQGLATPKGYTPAKIQKELAELEQALGPKDFARTKALADRLFAVQTPILEMGHDIGIIGDEGYNLFKSRGPEYIPMTRIMDDLANNRPISGATRPLHLRHQTVIQQLEGSVRTNVSPRQALAESNAKFFGQFYRNNAMRVLVDLAKNHPLTVGLEVTPVKPTYVAKEGEMIVGHYQNGRPDLYAVPTYLGETLQMAPLAVQTGLSTFANWWAHKFKQTVTVGALSFQAASVISHALSGMMLAPHGAYPTPSSVAGFIRDWNRALKDVLNNGQHVRELTRHGGASGTLQQLADPNYFASPSELGWKGKLARRQIIDMEQDFALAAENVNRVTIYTRAVQAGLTPKEAAWEAKEFGGMPPFDRGGEATGALDKLVMFFKAGFAYPRQVSTALRKNPMKVFLWAAVLTGMNVANASWNMQQVDSRGNNLLRKESVFQRDRNWIIELPWTYHTHAGAEKGWALLVPKPSFMRHLNPVEDTINYAIGKEARTGRQQAIDAVTGLSPIHMNIRAEHPIKTGITSLVGDIHPLAKLGIEQYANVDDFGRPIVPPRQENIDPQYQQNIYTSAIARRMGQGGVPGAEAGAALGATIGTPFGGVGTVGGAALGAGIGSMGISPRRIDVGARTLAGGSASQAEAALDPFYGGIQSQRSLEGPEYVRNLPVVGPIAGRFLASPADAEEAELSQRFHDAFNQAASVNLTFKYLLSQGKGAEAAKYIKDHEPELHKAIVLQPLMNGLKDLDKKLNTLQGLPNANTEPIRKSIETAYEARMMLLRSAKNMLDAQPAKASDTGPMGNQISNTSPSK